MAELQCAIFPSHKVPALGHVGGDVGQAVPDGPHLVNKEAIHELSYLD